MHGPDPTTLQPLEGVEQLCFVRPTIQRPLIEVGDYTYFHDFADARAFEEHVLYHFPFIGDRLVIGRYCSIASGVRFIMNGANHPPRSFANFPFYIFGHGWEVAAPAAEEAADPRALRGDTRVGHDVWLGYEALILPGVTIGDGAIVGARAVVTRDVEPYAIVAGNPARVVGRRFDDEVIELLLRVRWWDWPAERLTPHLPRLAAGDREWLRAIAAETS